MIKKNMLGYKILTDEGWKDFSGIRKIGNQPTVKILCENNIELICTNDHLILTSNDWKEAGLIEKGDLLESTKGLIKVIDKTDNGNIDVFDVLDVDGNKFYSNSIVVHNCEFVGATNTLVKAEILKELQLKTMKSEVKFFIDNDVRIYDDIQPNKKYLIGVDTSMGVQGDFAAIQILSLPDFHQVGEWLSDELNQNELVEKVKRICIELYNYIKKSGSYKPEIYWSLENNSSAEGFICALREKTDNLNTSEMNYIQKAVLISEDSKKRIGFNTNRSTKLKATGLLKMLIETNKIDIKSEAFVKQMMDYTTKDSLKASYNNTSTHDDLISALLVCLMIYLQEKNSLDLTFESKYIISKENRVYNEELPFLFFG